MQLDLIASTRMISDPEGWVPLNRQMGFSTRRYHLAARQGSLRPGVTNDKSGTKRRGYLSLPGTPICPDFTDNACAFRECSLNTIRRINDEMLKAGARRPDI